MFITSGKVVAGDDKIESRAYLRTSLGRGGCDLPNCDCSEGLWISISDGTPTPYRAARRA